MATTIFKKSNNSSPGYTVAKSGAISLQYRTKGQSSELVLREDTTTEERGCTVCTTQTNQVSFKFQTNGTRENALQTALALQAIVASLTEDQLTSIILGEDISASGTIIIGA